MNIQCKTLCLTNKHKIGMLIIKSNEDYEFKPTKNCLFLVDFIFREVLGSQKNWGIEIPTYFLPPPIHSLPHYQHLAPEWYICYNWWSYIDTSLLPKVHNYIRVHAWYCTFYEFWQMYPLERIVSLPWKSSVLSLLIPPYQPGHHWSFYCLHSFAFSW